MKIINIVGTGRQHFGVNTYSHGQDTYGINDAYHTAPEVRKWMKFYVTSEALENARPGRFPRYEKAYTFRKSLVVSDADLGLPKQRKPNTAGLEKSGYNMGCAESIAVAEAVTDGAKRIILYRVSLEDDNAADMAAVLYNVAKAEAEGVQITWAWRKYVSSKVQPAEPPKPKPQRKPRKRKTTKKDAK